MYQYLPCIYVVAIWSKRIYDVCLLCLEIDAFHQVYANSFVLAG